MAIIALFVVAFVSLLIVRVGATAFKMTGLSRDVADFQAVSCFFGVGFTTGEAELIVSHAVRRKIATHLIILGNIGLTSALGALLLTVLESDTHVFDNMLGPRDDPSTPLRLLAAVVGVAVIVLVFGVRFVKALMERLIRFTLERTGAVRAMDYETVLRAGDGWEVAQFDLDPTHPTRSSLIGRTVASSGLHDRGVLVLGIDRASGEYVGAPGPQTPLEAGDLLTIYARDEVIREACCEEDRLRHEAAGG
ncbi:MAG: TrkA C-terminal domain-containing protein [Planctomycetota bacterium]